MPNLSTFMISVDSRINERAKTLPQFIDIGLLPEIVLPIMPPSSISNTEQFIRALRSAVWRKHDVLLIEDDIDINQESFVKWLNKAINPNDAVTFCMLRRASVDPKILQAIQECKTVKPEFYITKELSKWYGTQCVYIPYLLAKRIYEYGIPDGWDNSFDVLLRTRLTEWQLRLLHCASDPVQHRAPPSVVNSLRKPLQSVTYGLGVDWQ